MILAACLMVVVVPPKSLQASQGFDIHVSGETLESFFKAASPFHYRYEMVKGVTAAEISFSNPKVIISQEAKRKIFVQFDYRGQSGMLGLEPFSGKSRPEISLSFDPARRALKVDVKQFVIDAGGRMKIKLDNFIDPIYLPLKPSDPIDLGDKKIQMDVPDCLVEVTATGVRLKGDFLFTTAK